MGRLEGKVAIVTGGATGIRRAVAERIVADGGRVVVGDIRDEPLRELRAVASRRASSTTPSTSGVASSTSP